MTEPSERDRELYDAAVESAKLGHQEEVRATSHSRTPLYSEFLRIRGIAAIAAAREEACVETQMLAYRWMQQHDALLHWIQQRPAVLKELIESDPRQPSPNPADLPTAIEMAREEGRREERARCAEIAREHARQDYVPESVADDIATEIERSAHHAHQGREEGRREIPRAYVAAYEQGRKDERQRCLRLVMSYRSPRYGILLARSPDTMLEALIDDIGGSHQGNATPDDRRCGFDGPGIECHECGNPHQGDTTPADRSLTDDKPKEEQ